MVTACPAEAAAVRHTGPAVFAPLLGASLMALQLAFNDFSISESAAQVQVADSWPTLVKAALVSVLLAYGVLAFVLNAAVRGPAAWLLAYASVCTFSVTYSPILDLAVGAALQVLALAFFAHAMSGWGRAAVLATWNMVFTLLALVAVLSLAWLVLRPDLAMAYVGGADRLRGITGAPNSLGPLAAYGILVGMLLVARLQREPLMSAVVWGGIAVMGWVLMLTQSRGAMVGLGAALLLAWILGGAGRFRRLVIFTTAVLFVAALFADLLVEMLVAAVARSGNLDELLTATGRLAIFQFSVGKWLEAPWLGFGLGSARVLISEGYVTQWGYTTGTAHNFLLESLLSVGLVGTLLLLGVVFAVVRSLGSLHRRPGSTSETRLLVNLCQCTVTLVVVHGLVEKSIGGQAGPALALLALAAGTACALARQTRAETRLKEAPSAAQ